MCPLGPRETSFQEISCLKKQKKKRTKKRKVDQPKVQPEHGRPFKEQPRQVYSSVTLANPSVHGACSNTHTREKKKKHRQQIHTHSGLTVDVNAMLEIYQQRQQKDPRCGRDHLSQCNVRFASRALAGCLSACLPAFLAGSRWPAWSLILPVHAQTTHIYTQQTRALIHRDTHTHTVDQHNTTAAPADATDRPTEQQHALQRSEDKTEAAAHTTRLLNSFYSHAPQGPFGLPLSPLELKSIF